MLQTVEDLQFDTLCFTIKNYVKQSIYTIQYLVLEMANVKYRNDFN